MKKVLLLVLVAALLLACAGCAKKAETREMCAFDIFNGTGGDVTQVAVKDNKTGEQAASGKIGDGDKIGLSINAVIDDAGNPDLTFSYTDAEGAAHTEQIAQKKAELTLQGDGSVAIKAPEA